MADINYDEVAKVARAAAEAATKVAEAAESRDFTKMRTYRGALKTFSDDLWRIG